MVKWQPSFRGAQIRRRPLVYVHETSPEGYNGVTESIIFSAARYPMHYSFHHMAGFVFPNNAISIWIIVPAHRPEHFNSIHCPSKRANIIKEMPMCTEGLTAPYNQHKYQSLLYHLSVINRLANCISYFGTFVVTLMVCLCHSF